MSEPAACDHDLDAEFLYPSDFDVIDVFDEDGAVHLALALPCPECDEALRLEADITACEEGDFDLPLDDSMYD